MMITFFTNTQKRIFSSIILLAFVFQILSPSVAYALTSGPAQPEFSSFEPVATTDMVNPITGDFNYNLPVLNVPGPNGGGYALSLSYHAGVNMEEDASWVGYGWTLNPGAINRGKKGFADDFNGKTVENINTTHKTITATGSRDVNLDFLTVASPSYGTTIKYNNFTGFSGSNQYNLGIAKGVVSVGYNKGTDGSSSFSFEFNPAALFAKRKGKSLEKAEQALKASQKKMATEMTCDQYEKVAEDIKAGKENVKALQSRDQRLNASAGSAISSLGTSVLGYAFADDQRPVSVSQFSGRAGSFRFNIGPTPTPLDVTLRGGIGGSYAQQTPMGFSKPAKGYLYTDETFHGGYDDYSVEKESSYNKRDQFLSVPFSAPDDFVVTGEGLSGAFRFRKEALDIVGPPNIISETARFRGGADINVGTEFGWGGALGENVQHLEVNRWDVNHLGFQSTQRNDTEEPTYLRYNGDLAQNLNFSTAKSDRALSAFFKPYPKGSNDAGIDVELSKYQTEADANVHRVKRASYIGYHTNKDMTYKAYLAYEKRQEISALTRRDGDYEDLIGEISSVNEDGNRYIYGLPVYSRKEKNRSHGVKAGGNCVAVNKVVYYNVDGTRKLGQNIDAPYASTYLLTQITSSDYIDRTLDGPTQDDFGGWTKFSYDKKYGAKIGTTENGEIWYNWRSPYNGLNYAKNSHSDVRDDMGTYVSGQKEIYYLKSVETKTHIAKFILNEDERHDGLSAHPNDELAAQNSTTRGGNKQNYLQRIELYAKNPNNPAETIGKPIKTVYFAYAGPAEELCKGLPSSNNNGGKLTLKKVWFEYEGVVKSKISPYEFVYAYKKKKPVQAAEDFVKYFRADGPVSTDYNSIVNELSETRNENPNYNVNAVDAWGNLAYKAESRNQKLMPWDYQGVRDTTAYDPAAWNLKTIVLPSGGQILVQYEEKDYSYVQNLPANCMLKLKSANHTTSKYGIDLTDLGDFSDGLILNYRDKLRQYFGIDPVTREDFKALPSTKIFYKLLFKLIPDAADDVSSCGTEYITGYCKVKNIDIVEQAGKKTIVFELSNDGHHGITTPTEACRDFYAQNRAMLDINNACANPDPYDDGGQISNLETLIGNLAVMSPTDIEISKSLVPYGVSTQHSYLRVPLPDQRSISDDQVEMVSKKGGGLRVKRLMIYDPGLVKEDETLYGTEYIYKLQDGRSSGVASNEPWAEENVLKHAMDKRLPQAWYQRMLSGDDLEEFEGPIGETLLPGPVVSHSRIITRSIYDGPSTAGFTENQYYTVKDFPSYKMDKTPVDNTRRQWAYVPLIFANVDIDNRWSAQGYSFITNDMHGKPKSTCRYGGQYKAGVPFDENEYQKSYEEKYNYYQPGEQVPVFKEDGSIAMQVLGREEDCTMESKEVNDVSEDIVFNFHTGVGFLVVGLVPNFWISGAYTHSERKLKTVVTNRVIHYKTQLKSTVVTKDGLTYVTENRAFDPMTGDPLITVTSDEYYNADIWNASAMAFKNHNYLYTSYNTPARYISAYKNFGGKYINENYRTDLVSTATPIAATANVLDYTIKVDKVNNFVKGDLICLYNDAGAYAHGYLSKVDPVTHNLDVCLLNTDHASNLQQLNRLWVVNSGYTNQLKASAGQITSYNPGELLTYSQKPVADLMPTSPMTGTLSNVISASASVYSDDWTMSDYILGHYGIDGSATTYNKYATGERGKWRLQASYAYKASLKDEVTTASAVGSISKTFAQGTFKYTPFDHSSLSSNLSWIRGNVVKYYSPNGDALEEENAVNIPSAAKFGHHENVPLMVAANARFSNILFNGFEDQNGSTVLTDKLGAHTGNKYLSIAPQTEQSDLGIIMSTDLLGKDVLVRWWSRAPVGQIADWQLKVIDKSATQSVEISTAQVNTLAVARSGAWTLYESVVKLTGVTDNKKLSFSLLNNANNTVYVDDYRVQPADAQATCFVYDQSNLRLLATFDDRHFAMIYQYDAEGKLVRKIVETEKGMKTISETQYNVPGKSR